MKNFKHPPIPLLAIKECELSPDSGLPRWLPGLYEQAGNANIFLSPSWVKTWLGIYGHDFEIREISWWHEDNCVAGVLLLFRQAKRGPFPIRLAILNTAGEADENAPFIEYNNVLCLDGYEDHVACSLSRYLTQQSWDQLYLAGYCESSVIARLKNYILPGAWDSIGKNGPYIDLTAINEGGLDMYFSSNTRTQIRRSIKIYEKRGTLRVEAASNLEECFIFLDALAELHRAAWERREQPGGFRSERFILFHKSLIQELWPEHSVELLRISSGNDVIGYIYNYLSENKVYFYQSGFAHEEDSKIKPGMVTHYLAASDYLSRGFCEYDFMAGEARYKKSLAKSCRTLHWSWVDRDNARMKLINLARNIVRYLRDGGSGNRKRIDS